MTWDGHGDDVVDLIYQAICTAHGAEMANLIVGLEASGNPRPLSGLSPEQLQGIGDQLEEMGRDGLGASEGLDAAQVIVADEMHEKTRRTN